MDSQVSEKIPILREVRQGGPISSKLFMATLQEIYRNAQPARGEMNKITDGEKHAWPKICR